jgi:hypothetical protein
MYTIYVELTVRCQCGSIMHIRSAERWISAAYINNNPETAVFLRGAAEMLMFQSIYNPL